MQLCALTSSCGFFPARTSMDSYRRVSGVGLSANSGMVQLRRKMSTLVSIHGRISKSVAPTLNQLSSFW